MSGFLALLMIVVVPSSATAKAAGRVSASLTSTSFSPAQAGQVKLVSKFSSATPYLSYVLSHKHGAKWLKLRSITLHRAFKRPYRTSVQRLFGSMPVKPGRYRVKVSTHANGVTLSFTVVLVPGAFGKTTPANSATGQQTNVTLSWGSSSNATSYKYCVNTTNTGSCNGSWQSVATNTTVTPSGLTAGQTYYWQARAVNTAANTDADGGTWWRFTTMPVPSAFGKTTPANGATGQQTNVTLSWGSSSNATSYEYCVNTTNTGSCNGSWQSVATNTTVTPSGLTARQTYYWQVRADNSAGTSYADNGTWWSFTTFAPQAGNWTTSSGVSFIVSPDQTEVSLFSDSFAGPGCVVTTFAHNLPIANLQFSKPDQSGAFYLNGTFDSATTAHGTDGIDHIPGCAFGTYLTGGPFPWTATWTSS